MKLTPGLPSGICTLPPFAAVERVRPLVERFESFGATTFLRVSLDHTPSTVKAKEQSCLLSVDQCRSLCKAIVPLLVDSNSLCTSNDAGGLSSDTSLTTNTL